MHMEADLVRPRLWDNIMEVYVDGTVQDLSLWEEEYEKKKVKRLVQKMNEARGEMIMQVKDGQLSHMWSHNPMEIWEMLAKVHKVHGFAMQLIMKRKFLMLKKKPPQSMQQSLTKTRSLPLPWVFHRRTKASSLLSTLPRLSSSCLKKSFHNSGTRKSGRPVCTLLTTPPPHPLQTPGLLLPCCQRKSHGLIVERSSATSVIRLGISSRIALSVQSGR